MPDKEERIDDVISTDDEEFFGRLREVERKALLRNGSKEALQILKEEDEKFAKIKEEE